MDTKFIIYDQPQKTHRFKEDLIALRGHQCECCKNTNWLNQLITLEIHHKNGNKCDNTLDNLILLCPNCHSYTDNYGSKNKKQCEVSDNDLLQALQNSTSIRQALISLNLSDAGANYNRARTLMNHYNITLKPVVKKEKENFCLDCGKSIYPDSTRCIECENKRRITNIIERDELKQLIRTMPFVKIGEKYGVSDNAVRKWCKARKLPHTKKDINSYTDEEWNSI